MGGINSANATDLTAGIVMEKMNDDQQFGYVSGVVEGLAYARFLQDRPDATGMRCIYDWYYKKDAKELWKTTLFPAFKKHNDKTVGVIVYALLKRECGA